MRPFLLLSIRPEQAAADDEYEAFRRYLGVTPDELVRVQLTARDLGPVELADYSGIVLGGGPLNASDRVKSPLQARIESDLDDLLDRVLIEDFPLLGACYGIGAIGTHIGARVDTTYSEPVGPLQVSLTSEGRADPLFEGVPDHFTAYGGHKEAVSWLPRDVVRLATSQTCPVQAFRVGSRVYAAQFHPELDLAGLHTRVQVYREAGYFPPNEADSIIATAGATRVEHPMRLLANFARLFAR